MTRIKLSVNRGVSRIFQAQLGCDVKCWHNNEAGNDGGADDYEEKPEEDAV